MSRTPQCLMMAGLVLILSACGDIASEPANETAETSVGETNEESYKNIPSLVPVADYTGEEYELRDADPDMEISAEMESEIETAVKDFFIENYKTEVKMNRYFHGDGYVRAVVESVSDPLFYTEVNVGLEKDGDTVTGVTGVGAREGEIEQAITSGLIAMVREEQFAELDKLLEEFVEEYPVRGIREEVVKNVNGDRYATPYYFVSNTDKEIYDLLNTYTNEVPIDKQFWKERYGDMDYDQNHFTISISLHMVEPGVQPDPNVADELLKRIDQSTELPRAGYSVSVHDSSIIGKMSVASKDNSITDSILRKVIKE